MFQFMTSARIIFGEGVLKRSLSLLNHYGYSVLLVSGQETQRAQVVVEYLKRKQLRYQHVAISGEPYIKVVESIAQKSRHFKPYMVVAIGGGSVIDTGKAVAALIPNKGDLYDYVDVIGRNVPLKTKPLPFIAIPTTAGPGAEVTNKAVLKSGQDRMKVSLRSPDMLADVAIIDPTLTYRTDMYKSARGAMDTFTHLVEAYVCGRPNSISDMICEEGLKRLRRSILPACLYDDHVSRSDLCFASMLGGMAVSNANQGAAYGLASALAVKLDAPHSVITAQLVPYVMQENIHEAKCRGCSDIVERYQRISQILTGRTHAHVDDSILWVEMMLDKLPLPELSSFGGCRTSYEEIVNDALKSSSIKGNPIPLTKERLMYILNQICPVCASNTPAMDDEPEFNAIEYFGEDSDVKGNEPVRK